MAVLTSLRNRIRGGTGNAGKGAANLKRRTLFGAPLWATVLVAIAILAVLYWGLLGWLFSDTSVDLSLRPTPEALPPGGSVTAAYAATLTEEQLGRGGWTPNDSILAPTALLNEMPAFQEGTISVVAATVQALADITSNSDLADAAEDYAVEPARGFFNSSFPFIGGSAGAHYRSGAETLIAYNNELATSEREHPQGARQARALLEAVSDAMRPAMDEIDLRIRGEESGASTAELHARVRGEAYAAALMLRGIRSDFDPVLREQQLGSAIVEAIEQLDRVAETDPLIVSESDLTSQGYFLRSAQESIARMSAGLAG